MLTKKLMQIQRPKVGHVAIFFDDTVALVHLLIRCDISFAHLRHASTNYYTNATIDVIRRNRSNLCVSKTENRSNVSVQSEDFPQTSAYLNEARRQICREQKAQDHQHRPRPFDFNATIP